MSSNSNPEALAIPVSILRYRDIANSKAQEASETREQHRESKGSGKAEVELSEAEFSGRIKQEREAAAREVESKLRCEYEERLNAAQAAIRTALAKFSDERLNYFSKVEAEVVQLSLSIAAKILHRESQIDPMVVTALVRVAIDRMKETSSVSVRVNPSRLEAWKRYVSDIPELGRVEVVADDKVEENDCVLESEVGSANFGLDKQLKEIEQGFFDLLALRPAKP